MADPRVFDKARQLREQAAATVGNVKESLASAAADARDAGAARIKEAIEEFTSTFPILREAGYQVGEVDIEVGLPPKISANVTASDAVTDEHIAKVLEEHREKKLITLLVKALYQAWRLQSAIQIAGMKPRGMTIELGLVPSVTIKFVGDRR
jgi:hypothetical protein